MKRSVESNRTECADHSLATTQKKSMTVRKCKRLSLVHKFIEDILLIFWTFWDRTGALPSAFDPMYIDWSRTDSYVDRMGSSSDGLLLRPNNF